MVLSIMVYGICLGSFVLIADGCKMKSQSFKNILIRAVRFERRRGQDGFVEKVKYLKTFCF